MIYSNVLNFITVQEFIDHMDLFRKENKNKWYCFQGTVAGYTVQLKAFNLYNQILTVNGWELGGIEHKTVKAWKHDLARIGNVTLKKQYCGY